MTPDPRQEIARLWLSMMPGTPAGTMRLRISRRAPATGSSIAVLLSRGQLSGMDDVDAILTTGTPLDGRSAYQLARDAGYGGTLAQWLASLSGAEGKSAYDIARELGYGGTKTQWLASLSVKGDPGAAATTLVGPITLAETNLIGVTAGVRRRVIATTFDLPLGVPLLLQPKAPPPAGWIVQAAWATKVRELTVDLTVPAITVATSYSIDCWLLRLNATP